MSVVLVKELKNLKVGERVLLDASVKSCLRKKASNGSFYLDLTLADNEEEINGKLWGVTDQVYEFISTNRFVRVVGVLDEFNKKLQINVSKVSPIPEVELDESKLVMKSPEDENDLLLEIEATISEIKDEAVRTVVSRRLEKNKEKFLIWPAAKSHHHNYSTGLIYHTASMLRLAKNNIRQYPGKLDADIILGAIVLHDIDKVHEYSDPYTPEFTEAGTLMGHIFMSGANTYHESLKLREENPDINLSKIKYLIHAILAHHGKLEWGSPVTPKTIEAEIVHQIDMMDSRMNSKY